MDEEELEGLLPRTDLDNASQGTVSTQDAILGTQINAPAGVGAPSNKVSIPSFGQPGAGVMPAMPAMPTIDQAAPAVENYGDYFRPVTTLESQPFTQSQEADLFGSQALDEATRNGNMQDTGLVTMVPSDPLTEQDRMGLVQSVPSDPFTQSDRADLLEMQGLDNLRKNGADSLMGAYNLPESDLVRVVPSDPLTESDRADLFGMQGLDNLRQNGAQNLAEAYGNTTGNTIALPAITRESDTPFEASALMPDGSTRGYLIGGGSRTMSPEEMSQYDKYVDTIQAPEQAVPGTDGFVRFPKAPVATAPVIAPATEQPVPVQPNPVAPAEQAVSAPRALTTADVENPALDGMSAAEKIAAVNTPGYQSPDLAAIPAGGRPTSKFGKFADFATGVIGGASDISLGVAKLGLSPFTMTKDYLMGTEDNKNPTIFDVTGDTYKSITDTPMSDFLSGRSAQERAGQAASQQDQRNAEFLANDPGVQYRDGAQLVESDQITPEQMNEFMGAEGSPQRAFVDKVSKGPLTDPEIAAGYQFADRNQINFDPQSGFSKRPATLPPEFSVGPPQIERGPYRPNAVDPGFIQQAPQMPVNAPLDGPMNASQFMRYEDNPANRTEQFVDPQGRLRRRLTPQASAMQGNPAGVQPLAPEYSSYEADGAAREARLREREDQAANDRNNRLSGSVEGGRSNYSNSDLRKIFGRGAEYNRAKALAQNGIDPVTMKSFVSADSDAKTAELRQRVLEAEAVAAEKGEDPAEARRRILNNQLLEERISELRKQGLPEDITMKQGEFGTVIVRKGNRDISYFKQGEDIGEQLVQAGIIPEGTLNANEVDSGSGNTVRMVGRNKEPRDVPKGNVQEALQNGYTIK